tara:strand:- start:327 stop:608 length:282 start_codon:yes stop_codon:yes gene_type:complete
MNILNIRLPLVLMLVIFLTAISIVVVRHQNRLEFLDIQSAQKFRDKLNDEWGRLQIEKATWARHNLIEKSAREELGMITPGPDDIFVLQSEKF